MTDTKIARILLVGGGAVGAIVALNIESGKRGQVTAVLRSNFEVVRDQGYTIESVDHGDLRNWRPSHVVSQIPDVQAQNLEPFDYIITTTKNCPDVPPALADLIARAVTPAHTVIVMIQNGLNIETPVIARFPSNIVLSGVSMIGCHERGVGEIVHEEHDKLEIGAFDGRSARAEAAAQQFVAMYGAAGRTQVSYSADVAGTRWRKLVFNAVLNPLCAITRLDTARVRLSGTLVEGLARPAMQEIVAIAARLGHELPGDIVDTMINADPIDLYLKPSMQVDLEKGNLMEVEYLVGEPLREAEKCGVPAPNLRVIYEIIRAIQWRIKEEKGYISIPPKRG